jgi:hypothetical protein
MNESPILKEGDVVSMDVTVRRRWWQLWKPRVWTERREGVLGKPVTADPPQYVVGPLA